MIVGDKRPVKKVKKTNPNNETDDKNPNSSPLPPKTSSNVSPPTFTLLDLNSPPSMKELENISRSELEELRSRVNKLVNVPQSEAVWNPLRSEKGGDLSLLSVPSSHSPHRNSNNDSNTHSNSPSDIGGLYNAMEDHGNSDREYIPALLLQLGRWQKFSSFPGDLVASLSFQSRQFAWEIFANASLMYKVLVPFDLIESLGLQMLPNGIHVLAMDLKSEPHYFTAVLHPHGPNVWSKSTDFTGGFATMNRRHVIYFPEGGIISPMRKLLNLDPHIR
jgi:hypothetical protein